MNLLGLAAASVGSENLRKSFWALFDQWDFYLEDYEHTYPPGRVDGAHKTIAKASARQTFLGQGNQQKQGKCGGQEEDEEQKPAIDSNLVCRIDVKGLFRNDAYDSD